MSEREQTKENNRNFWHGVLILGALVLGTEILLDN